MEHIKLFKCLNCHRNLLTSSKAVFLCLKQVLVVRTSLIQISGTRTSFLTILRFLCVILFIICHDFNPSVWHTQRMTNFVTIFLWRFFAPVWHSKSKLIWLALYIFRHLIKPAIYREKRFSCACRAIRISLKTPSRDRIFRGFGGFWRIRCKNRSRVA